MTRLKCLRCGGQDFHETEQHRYHDIEVLEKERKTHANDNWYALNVISDLIVI